MKRILTILLSLALPSAALAADWFDAEIAGYTTWPTNPPAGEWSGTTGTTLDTTKHVLDVDTPADTTLTFSPVASCDAASNLIEQVVFVSTNTLTAIQPIAQLAPLEQTVKAAIAVAVDATAGFYGWAKDPAGSTNVWLALSGATPVVDDENEVRVLFKTVESALQVQYQVNGTALTAGGESWLPVATQGTTLAHAGMRGGNLEVASLYAFTEDTPPPPLETVVLSLDVLPANVTLVSVTTNDITVAPVEGAYTVYSNATVAVTFAPAEGYRLVGDATVTVEMDADKTLATADMPTAELIPPPPATATLTIPELPANVSLVSVTTNGVAVSAVEGAYTVLSNDTVTVTFAAAEGYRLVGDATVPVVMDQDKTLTGIPTAELIPIPTATLTIPSPLPENVSLVSVTTNGVAVAGAEGAYTVYSNATVVATFAAAEGYALSPAATVSVVMDGDKTLDGIPTALSIAGAIRINEIMASNADPAKGGFVSELGIPEMDWIEFYNAAPVDVDITGWFLSDNVKPGKETKATILGSCVVPANGYKIVWLDKIHTNATEYAETEAFAILKLSSDGDLIQLADAGTNVLQQVDFSTKRQIKGYSYGPVSVVSGGNLVPGNGPFVYMKTATPGAANVTEGWGDFTPAVAYSEPHGYKTEPFDLTLSCSDPTADIYYTLDGSSPTTDSILYTNAIPISKTTVIRAAVPDPTAVLQLDTSATYIFLDDVLAEPRSTNAPVSAVGFPTSKTVNGQEMLYGMEQSIVNGADRNRLLRGFTNTISTVSLVIDPTNLFDRSAGIYVNPRGEGREWEREMMLEFFDPKGVEADVTLPAGLRIRGGNSRNTGKPKHSFRLFFRSEYGQSSLAAKMFLGESVKEAGEYDKIDLRTSQNLSWANENNAGDTFVTEVFARDSQRDMGSPYTRSRYYNLFINGQYWGLYQTQERADEHFGESYLGGDSLQYDLIKASSTYANNKLGYLIECNEGTWDAWEALLHIAVDEGFGPGHEDNYNKVLGLNPDGTRNPAYPILLNPESLMSFMFSSHFMVDQDGPTSPYSSIDKGHANNFAALRNRDDAGDVNGFIFLRHDAEVAMNMNGGNTAASKDPTYWGTEAIVWPNGSTPDLSGGLGSQKFRTRDYFTPAELHYLLMQNPTYARQYADAFYKFFLAEGGAMTIEKCLERYASRMAEIDDAIVCEAARWGKSKNRTTWLNACKTATNFVNARVSYMKSQYQTHGWYPSIDPPRAVDALGAPFAAGDLVASGAKVFLTGLGTGTNIWYTLDGSDPLDEADQPTASAVAYTAEGFALTAQFTTVRARAVADGEVSALSEIKLEQEPEAPTDLMLGIRVAGIMNACAGDGDSDDFIILTNLLDRAVSLADLRIVSMSTGDPESKASVAFTLGETNIAANGTLKLMANPWWFDKPQPASASKTCKLKNGDIDVVLTDTNRAAIVQTATVSGNWWPIGTAADGKVKYACKQTGAHFVAIDFGTTVSLQDVHWIPSFMPPLASSDGYAVVTAAATDPDVKDWLDELGATSDGRAAVEAFNGTAEALDTCYLVDILPESNPEVELTMPSITFDENGMPVVEGELLHHGTEIEKTVRGQARLYYADSLEDLETTTDYVQISPPTFPVTTTNDVTGAQIPNARFYRLKIE